MEPTKQSLITIVDQARTGKVVLPEFQRSFIWTRREIEELLVSVFNGYFIGSLLTLNVVPESVPFRARVVEGVKGVQPCPSTMILDGQQRVTSVHYALYGPKVNLKGTSFPYRFFVDIRAALDDRWDDAVTSRPSYHKSVPKVFGTPVLQYKEGLLALGALRSWQTWMHWYMGYKEYLDDANQLDQRALKRLADLAERFLNFQVAVITMAQSTPLPTVVEVFERINRTGAPLGVFELLTARLWRDDIALRDLWDEALQQHPKVAAASAPKSERYPKFALQVVALLRGKECKRKELILLEGESFREHWRRALRAMEAALGRMQSTESGGYGVIDKLSVPYSTMVTPLALLWDHIGYMPEGKADAYEKLNHWYWSSVFRERYGGSTESTSYRDISQLKAWFENDRAVPDAVPTHRDQIKRELVDVVRVGAVYHGVLCLVALQGAVDFFTGQSIQLHELDDHHIFPRAFFGKGDTSTDKRNSILNRTLISSDTNRRVIGAKRPSVYLADMEAELGKEAVRKILATHFIDDAGIEAMRSDDFGQFLAARERTIRAEIVTRCVYSAIGAVIKPEESVRAGDENARLDRVESALRDLIDELLQEVGGVRYWRRLVPPDIRAGVSRRLTEQEELHPRRDGRRQVTNRQRLDLCDFSDYAKIVLQKTVWPTFESVFSRRNEFERHMTSVRRYRNALKHGREVESVEHLAGTAAVIWFERAIGEIQFSDRVSAEPKVAMEDCLRVLTRRVVPPGQRALYQALVESGPQGLSAGELAEKMGREPSELSGVLGALGRRVNNTPGFGATHGPGTGMLLNWDEGRDGGRYRLKNVTFRALRELAPQWLSDSDLAKFVAAKREGRRKSVQDDGLTEKQRLHLQFWTEFKAHVEASSHTLRPQTPRPDYWTGYAIGRAGCSLAAFASFWNARDRTYETNELRAELHIEGQGSHDRFDTLTAREEEIEAALGFELSWEKIPDRNKCRAYARRTVDLADREAWADHRAWLLDHLEALDRVFRPIVAGFD